MSEQENVDTAQIIATIEEDLDTAYTAGREEGFTWANQAATYVQVLRALEPCGDARGIGLPDDEEEVRERIFSENDWPDDDELKTSYANGWHDGVESVLAQVDEVRTSCEPR